MPLGVVSVTIVMLDWLSQGLDSPEQETETKKVDIIVKCLIIPMIPMAKDD